LITSINITSEMTVANFDCETFDDLLALSR